MSKKKIFLIIICVVAAVVAGLLYYVTHIDWNTQKENIAARFSKTSGRKIEFTGNLSVSLFPSPHLEANDVNILNDETSEKLATVTTLEAELSLRALLQGIPDIQSMSLIGSEFWFIVDENGVSNWHQKQKSQFLDIDVETGLQKLNIRDSLVHYRNKKYELNQELQQVNAEIIAKSFVGPYRLDGNFVKDKDHFGIAVNVGDFSQSDDVSFSFAVTHPNSESFIRYDGTYNFSSGNFKGDLSGNAKHAADFINIVFGQPVLSDEFNRQLLFSVTAAANKKALKLSSFAVKFSNYLEGSGQILLQWPTTEDPQPKINLQYQMVNLDLQPLILRWKQYFQNVRNKKTKYLPDIPIQLQYNLESERVILSDISGGFVENVSAKGSWKNNEFTLDESYIACPGNIVLTMSGSLRSENALPQYFAKAKLEGKRLLELLNSFGAEITPPNQSAYRYVNLDFNISGNPLELNINEAKLMLDKANYNITGKLNFSPENTLKQLEIVADKVNFDNYLPAPDAELTVREQINTDFQKLAVLKDKNWKVKFKADSANIRGIPYTGFGFQANTQNKVLHLIDFMADDVLGSKIRLSADLGNLGSAEPSLEAFEYDISTKDISPILTKLQIDSPYTKDLKNKNIQSSGLIKGSIEQAAVNLNAQIGNIKLSYNGDVSKNKEQTDFNGTAELKTLNLSELLNTLGNQEYKKLSSNSVFNCAAKVSGHINDWHFSDLNCILGTAQYSGNLNLKLTDETTDITGKIKTTEFDLSTVTDIQPQTKPAIDKNTQNTFWQKPNWSTSTINYDIYKNKTVDLFIEADKAFYENMIFNNLTTHITNTSNELSLEELSFVYNNADYSGSLKINYEQTPTISGNIRGGNIRLSNIGGSVYKITDGIFNFSSSLSGKATSVADLITGATGYVEFVIDTVNINGFDFNAIIKDLETREYAKGLFQVIHNNLQKGYTFFDTLSGQAEVNNGVLNITQMSLNNKEITLSVTGQVQLKEWKTNNLWTVTLNQREEMPQFTYSLNGNINKPDLQIKIDDIVKKYDEFWEKEAEAKRLKREAEQKEKERLMTNAQQEVTAALNKFQTVYNTYTDGRNATDLPESIALYDKYLSQLGEIQQNLLEMQAFPKQQNYQNEDSKRIEQDSLKYMDELKDIELQYDSLYSNDVHARFSATKEVVQKMKDDNTVFYDNYQKMLQDKFAELQKYRSISYMLNNNELLDMQREIDQIRDNFWEKCYQFSDKFTQYFGLEEIRDIEEATTELKQSIIIIEHLQKQMNDLQQKMEKQLNAIIAERKKIFDENEAKREAEENARQAEKEAEEKAKEEAEKEKSKPKAASSDKLTPTQFRKATASPAKQTPATEPQPTAAKPKHTLEAVENILLNHEVSGTITKSYEEIPEYKLPGIGILEPVEGKMPETSGKIITK